jgi:hypothetical protein
MKKNDISMEWWWSLHESVAPLVVNIDSFNKCLKFSSDWADVADDVLNVVKTSSLGQAVFGPAHAALQSSQVSKLIETSVAELAKGTTPISLAVLKESKTQFVRGMQGAGFDPFESFPKKMVGVAYRGFLMDVPVNSWIEQHSLSVSGFVKTVGVETGVLDPLFIENDLLVTGDDHKDRRINDAVIIEARSARSAASKLLDGVEDSNGDVIAKTLTSKRVLLLSLDPNFKVEEAFWTSLRGERGLKALQSRILKCLPNDGEPKSLEASNQDMYTLAKTPVFEYCGRGVAGQF